MWQTSTDKSKVATWKRVERKKDIVGKASEGTSGMLPRKRIYMAQKKLGKKGGIKAARDIKYKWSGHQRIQRRRLMLSLAESNNRVKLELLGAWEPTCSECPLSLGERTSSQSFLSYGDETNH